MGKDLIKCTEGSDAACLTAEDTTSCCMFMEVTEVLSEQNDKEKTTSTEYADLGFPVEEGESEFMCTGKLMYD